MKTKFILFFIAIVASLFIFGCSNNETGGNDIAPNDQETASETNSGNNEPSTNDVVNNNDPNNSGSETDNGTDAAEPTDTNSEFETLKAEYFSEPTVEQSRGMEPTLFSQIGVILLGFSAEDVKNSGIENWYLNDFYFNQNDRDFYEDFFEKTKLESYNETEGNHQLINETIVETNENGDPIHTWYLYEINLLSNGNLVYTEERIYETVLDENGEEKIKSYYR